MLQARLLGQFNLRLDGQTVEFASRPAQLLFAYLLLNLDKPHRREKLAGLLWPDANEANARSNLRSALWRARKALQAASPGEREYLRANDESIGLSLQPGDWLDVAVLETKVGVETPTGELVEMVTVYGGELLPGFYEDWVVLERERLQAAFERKLGELLERLLSEARWHEVLEWGERWIAQGSTPEPAYRALMLAHAGLGDLASAAETYRRCVAALERELGVEPSEQTRQVYEQIQTGRNGGSAPDSPFLEPGIRTPLSKIRHNLPAQLSPFLGRGKERLELKQMLAESPTRLVTLVGPGGIGKTRLAIQVGSELLQENLQFFRDGIYFISLAGLMNSASIVPAIAEGIKFEFYTEKNAPLQELARHLQPKKMLLVLDNFEHLIDEHSIRLLVELLSTAAELKILVTSRARLNAHNEQVYPLAGLDIPQRDELAQWSSGQAQSGLSSSLQLFEQSARRVQPSFRLAAEDLLSAARICRLVEGMPLAIELSAAWMSVLSLEEILSGIEASLDFLETERLDLPERQRSMRAVIDNSWSLLGEPESQAVQKLSIFRGGFTREAAGQVAGISAKLLMALANKCWIQRDGDSRFQMHELMRQYAQEKLRANPNLWEQNIDRYSAYFFAFLQDREDGWFSSRQENVLSEIEADLQNIQNAWQLALSRGQIQKIGQGMKSLFTYYDWRGLFKDGESIARQALESMEQALPRQVFRSDPALRVRANLLTWQSHFTNAPEMALALLQQSQAILEQLRSKNHDVRAELAFLLLEKAERVSSTDRRVAKHLYQQSLDLFKTQGDQRGLAVALNNLGGIAWLTGEFAEAQQILQQSLAISRELGHRRLVAWALNQLGIVLKHRGSFEEAASRQQESVSIFKAVGARFDQASVQLDLANTLIWQGKFAEVDAHVQESKTILQDLGGEGVSSAGPPVTLSLASLHSGNYDFARQQALESLELARIYHNQQDAGFSLYFLGQLSLVDGHYAEARDLFQQSSAILQEIQQNLSALPWMDLGYVYRKLDDPQLAYRYLLQGLENANQIRSVMPVLVALPAVALLSADRGELARSFELYALACRYQFVANSRWFDEVAGQEIAAATASLPSEARQSSQERGLALDLWEVTEHLIEEIRGILVPYS